ncbi:similar to An01g14230 [Aspergillus luchuensis]|uniref:Similar to An01g14230 n=1 Tax=Aspergillus kawachii TaxID=1069201 RepID=A0A146FXC1_ASPKA|nr:similar to An01g14230 [Aspergillus luchuensis]
MRSAPISCSNRDESYYEFGATATVSIMCLASQLLGLRDAQEYHVLHEVNLRVLYEDGKVEYDPDIFERNDYF